ncbi:TyeA family type III secretion system gatekeeper subunit [Paraburkholderia sediminicola]|uniref:TyeA family type III secretion system gatekeeper subunit n=1 Tax=Paraburkholderia sediminicola TaxID=458836 RepID=UPI0038BB9F54
MTISGINPVEIQLSRHGANDLQESVRELDVLPRFVETLDVGAEVLDELRLGMLVQEDMMCLQAGVNRRYVSGSMRKAAARSLFCLSERSEDSLAEQLEECKSAAEVKQVLSEVQSALPLRSLCMALDSEALSSDARIAIDRAIQDELAKEEWALELYATVQLGELARAALPDIVSIYGHALAASESLVAWFRLLRGMEARAAKLKIAILALGEELGAMKRPDERERLMATIRNLKSLVLFFSMEDTCEAAARTLQFPEFDKEAMMNVVLDMLDDPWLFADSVVTTALQITSDDNERLAFLQELKRVTCLLPAGVFRDNEHQVNVMCAVHDACSLANGMHSIKTLA